jgi:hypothetical protein
MPELLLLLLLQDDQLSIACLLANLQVDGKTIKSDVTETLVKDQLRTTSDRGNNKYRRRCKKNLHSLESFEHICK